MTTLRTCFYHFIVLLGLIQFTRLAFKIERIIEDYPCEHHRPREGITYEKKITDSALR